jgi:hypothetical protein
MSDESKSLGQQYHEAVEALKAQGQANADAVREVAARFGKEVNAVRGGIHQYRAKHVGGSNGNAPSTGAPRRRSSALSVDDLLASAKQSLESALALVDKEVEQAKAALDNAQANYDQVIAGATDKKTEIEKKLKVLA